MPEADAGQQAGATTDAGSQVQQQQAGEETKTLTQSDLDKIIAGVRADERKKFGDYKDLQNKAGEYDKLVAAQQSAEEKLTSQLSETERRALAAESAAQELRIERAVARYAARKDSGIAEPEMAVRLLDTADLEFDQSGAPTDESLKKALAGLVERYPLLKGQAVSGSGDGGTRQSAPVTDMNALIRQRAGRA